MHNVSLAKSDNIAENQNLDIFRIRVQRYCRLADRNLNNLAEALKFSRSNLSQKLNGTDNAHLSHTEVKIIIKTLADWQAINSRFEALELLRLMNLGASSFTSLDWNSHPLNKLESGAFNAFPNKKVSCSEVVTLQMDSKTAMAVANIIKMLLRATEDIT